ncbi:MAG: NADH-quinone oxidoreductase subunit L [Bacteroidia bacterium]|nr:NADH-quinone oxidoreductase subunit L [Bacteroidia bacterium]
MVALYPLIILLPLAGAALNGLGGLRWAGLRRNESLVGLIGTACVAIPFLVLLSAFFAYPGQPVTFTLFSWIQAGGLDISFSYTLDELSLLMGLIVTGVGALIHLYSMGYMKGDPGYYKFFAYLNLFIFAMNNLILADNLLVMFLGWEGVGLCSYLLIGFWYTDMDKSEAAQKAFIVNRVGDFAMLLAMFWVYNAFGTLSFSGIEEGLRAAESGGGLAAVFGNKLTWIGALVFIAATGKSAQIPLFVWLPDAMAGPTPVSALIHAATMVTAGIYLMARMNLLFLATPEVLTVVVVVAGLTALMAALIAVTQTDIKRVLAYSTVSQLGFMFMALGAGAFTTAIFHVLTHAFFKACLFLGSGSVIHAMEHTHAVKDPQDIRTMGGLGKFMPSTSRTFWISTLAIAGIPGLSGFFSKDEILAHVFFNGYTQPLYFAVWAVGTLTAVLTAFYMTRLAWLTFNGTPRFHAEHAPHESPAIMTAPLWILGVLAAVGGYIGLPYIVGEGKFHLLNHAWLEHRITNRDLHHAMEVHHTMEYFLLALAVLISVGTVYWTVNFYRKHELAGDNKVKSFFGPLYRLMEGKFYWDELYDNALVKPFFRLGRTALQWVDTRLVDGTVNGVGMTAGGLGEFFRKMQTGLISNYVTIIGAGVVLMIAYLIFG